MFEEIYEQIEEYCDCLPNMEEEEKRRNIDEMLFLVSNLTCWTQSTCETLLNSRRVEFLDIDSFDPCLCNQGIIEFIPFYNNPIDEKSFEVYLITYEGIKEESERINSDYFAYSESLNLLKIDVRPFVQQNNCCACSRTYKLMIQYNAGYERLPDCLLRLFCDLLHVVAEKNNCDCDRCQQCNKGDDIEIEYDDDVTPKLDMYFKLLVESAYKKQLGLLSLCKLEKRVWGIVV